MYHNHTFCRYLQEFNNENVCVCVCVYTYVCKYDINVVMLFSYGNSTMEIKIEMLRIPY